MITKEEIKKMASSRIPSGRFKNLLRAIYHEVILSPEHIKFDKKNNCYLVHLNGSVPATSIRMPQKPFGILGMPKHEMSGYFSIPFLPNSIIIDAGAFPGDYSTIASTHAKNSRIIAIEPDPINNKYTQKVLSLNNLTNVVELLDYALSDKEELATFIQNYASSRITNNTTSPLHKTITVKTTTLDNILEARNLFDGRPIYVKMDIEGAEIQAYQGMLKTINYGLKHGAVFNIACYHENETREITGFILAKQFEAANYHAKIINKQHLTLVACSPAMTSLLANYSN